MSAPNLNIVYQGRDTRTKPPPYEVEISETKNGGVMVSLNGHALLSINPKMETVFWYGMGDAFRFNDGKSAEKTWAMIVGQDA